MRSKRVTVQEQLVGDALDSAVCCGRVGSADCAADELAALTALRAYTAGEETTRRSRLDGTGGLNDASEERERAVVVAEGRRDPHAETRSEIVVARLVLAVGAHRLPSVGRRAWAKPFPRPAAMARVAVP